MHCLLMLAAAGLAAANGDLDFSFCGVATGGTSFLTADNAASLKEGGIDWMWNWGMSPNNGTFPAGWKFVPSTWGVSLEGSPTNVTLGGFGTYTKHWGSAGSHYIAPPPGEEMSKLVMGWNEPDQVGICQGLKASWCPPLYYTQNDDNDPVSFDPKSKNYGAYYCCTDASSCAWWSPELSLAGQDIAGNAPLEQGWLASWASFAKTQRGAPQAMLSTPMIARAQTPAGEAWLRWFVKGACGDKVGHITDPSGTSVPQSVTCPEYINLHHYDEGCVSKYSDMLVRKVNLASELVEKYNLSGILFTELGLLNPKSTGKAVVCPLLPEYLKSVVGFLRSSKHVKGIAWFAEKGTGGTYDLSLQNETTKVLTEAGVAYKASCSEAQGIQLLV